MGSPQNAERRQTGGNGQTGANGDKINGAIGLEVPGRVELGPGMADGGCRHHSQTARMQLTATCHEMSRKRQRRAARARARPARAGVESDRSSSAIGNERLTARS
jgi:hypothetical protein